MSLEKKEITIYDLAVKLNISPTTVSRGLKNHPAINHITKKKIFDLAQELGYRTNHFARNLRLKKTNTIGVIVPRLNSYFMSTVIAGIEHVVNKAGYNLIISQSQESGERESANARTMFSNRIDGLLVSLSLDTRDSAHFEIFKEKGTPLVYFDRVTENSNGINVLIDNRKAAYTATLHLIEQGCKNLVQITVSSNKNVYVDRVKGFKEALEDSGITWNDERLIYGDLTMQAGASAAKTILESPNPIDGIFVANDNAAVGCLLALKGAGKKIPEEIAIIGFNNDPVSTVVEPNLTTINYPGYEMGNIAAQNLINHLNGTDNSSTNTILLRSELIVRESSLRKKIH